MGLVVFGVMALYLLISILVVTGAVKYARTNGKSATRWGTGAALVMYLIPFWDWLPTIATHQYYCAKEAGFWIYKTPEQWKKENPGVTETLVAQLSIQRMAYGELQIMDQRFAIETRHSTPVLLIPTEIAERLLIDRKTGDILAKTVEVGSGVGNMATGGGLKFWLNQSPCISTDFWELTSAIETMRGQK
jgi:hypothetical protein